MPVGFPVKDNYVTGDVLTAANMNDFAGTLNTVPSTIGAYAAGKNKILNSNFSIWQRGTSFSAEGYTADRFALRLSGATASVSRQSFTVGQTDVAQNPTYFLRLAVTTGDNSCRIETLLEDVTNSSGKTFTVSFWAKGTNPAGGNLEVVGRQEFGAGGSTAVSTSAGTITLTASWQRFTKTFTYPSISGKTLAANNSYGIDIRQPSSDTGVAAWTLDIANIQLEEGSVATPFQTATGTIQGELAACQRYYQRVTATNAYGAVTSSGAGVTSTTARLVFPTKVTLRGNNPAVEYANLILNDGANVVAAGTITVGADNGNVTTVTCTTVGVVAFRSYLLTGDNNAAGYLALSAEL